MGAKGPMNSVDCGTGGRWDVHEYEGLGFVQCLFPSLSILGPHDRYSYFSNIQYWSFQTISDEVNSKFKITNVHSGAFHADLDVTDCPKSTRRGEEWVRTYLYSADTLLHDEPRPRAAWISVLTQRVLL